MKVLPIATAVINPAALTVATPGLLEFQVAVLERFRVVELLKLPVAVIWSVYPAAMLVTLPAEVTVTEFSATPKRLTVPVLPLAAVAEMDVDPPLRTVATPVAAIVATLVLLEPHVTLDVISPALVES
jgi:hypothetical protein